MRSHFSNRPTSYNGASLGLNPSMNLKIVKKGLPGRTCSPTRGRRSKPKWKLMMRCPPHPSLRITKFHVFFRVFTFFKRRVFQKEHRGQAKNETNSSNGKEVPFPSNCACLTRKTENVLNEEKNCFSQPQSWIHRGGANFKSEITIFDRSPGLHLKWPEGPWGVGGNTTLPTLANITLS